MLSREKKELIMIKVKFTIYGIFWGIFIKCLIDRNGPQIVPIFWGIIIGLVIGAILVIIFENVEDERRWRL